MYDGGHGAGQLPESLDWLGFATDVDAVVRPGKDRVSCVPVERPGTSGARLAETDAAKHEAADLEP
jgi:hypothetical protein